MNRKVAAWGIGATLAGCFVGLVGLLVFVNRVPLAETFLGATVLLGMPWTGADSLKISIVGLGGLGVIAVGGLSIVGGVVTTLIQFARGR